MPTPTESLLWEKNTAPFVFHVSRQVANLMGLDLFTALGFAILVVTTMWQQQWPALFEGLGCLTTFSHKPITPVI